MGEELGGGGGSLGWIWHHVSGRKRGGKGVGGGG